MEIACHITMFASEIQDQKARLKKKVKLQDLKLHTYRNVTAKWYFSQAP